MAAEEAPELPSSRGHPERAATYRAITSERKKLAK